MPVIAFLITRRVCIGLQRADRERVLHGSESGLISRAADGGYSEPHLPISADEQFTLTQHLQHAPLEISPSTDARGIKTKRKVSPLRARLSRWYLRHDVVKPTGAELEAAAAHGVVEGREIEAEERRALEESSNR